MAEKKETKGTKKIIRKKKATKKAEKVELKTALEKIQAATVTAAPLPVPQPKTMVVPKPKKEKRPLAPRYYGTGRRKEAIARVWLTPGSGSITLNGKIFSEYFCGRKLLEFQVTRPLIATNNRGNYDVNAEVFGGGIPGQAGAVSLGIARALLEVNPGFKAGLKKEGLLRRDPRMKERKKYGLKRARKAFQYTKR